MALSDRAGRPHDMSGSGDGNCYRSRMKWLVARLAILNLVLIPTSLCAQTFSVQSIIPANMGTVAAGASGVTLFQIYGTTVTISGNGAYISGPQTTATVTIDCSGACNGATARVNIGRTGVNTGRAQTLGTIGAVAVPPASIGGTFYNDSGTLDVTLSGWTGPGTQQFQLGIRMPVLGDDSSTATTATSGFTVAVANNPTLPTGATPSTVTATVRRAITMAKISDLRFGTVVKPASGSFDVYISNTDGSRGTTPNAMFVNLVPSMYGPAIYAISGEPGTSFSLTYPSTFIMNGPDSLTANIVGNLASGNQSIPSGGTLNLVLGGIIPIASGQPTGSYSGSFVVTLAYN